MSRCEPGRSSSALGVAVVALDAVACASAGDITPTGAPAPRRRRRDDGDAGAGRAVVKKTLPIYLEYPGRIESIRNVTLQAHVSGYIEAAARA